MAVFLIDGGYFVKRFQLHWKDNNGKNMAWWKKEYENHKCTYEEYEEEKKRILNNDISYLVFRMEQMGVIERVFICYDGIFNRRPRGNLYSDYKRNRGGFNPRKHKGRDIRDKIQDCGFDPMNPISNWYGLYHQYKEADDLLAETTKLLGMCDKEIVIMSSDSDMYQLLGWEENVRIHNFTREVDAEWVFEKCGVEPSQYVDWKNLVGDSSDGIRGVKGIGKRKAAKLLQEYSSVEHIPDETLGGEENREYLKMARKLVTLPFGYA